MHIDVCAIPSFDIEKRPLLNHYNAILPTEGLLIPVQTLEETLADKFIALAYRARRIKPRDVWDIVWINQRGVKVSNQLIEQKLAARNKDRDDFIDALNLQLDKLNTSDEVRVDFTQEMSRFVPRHIKTNTLDNPEYWPYVQSEITRMSRTILSNGTKAKFDMGG